MQQRDTWGRMTVALLLCAMTLTGVAGIGLGLSWRFGMILPSMLGLFFMAATGWGAALLFYNRTHATQLADVAHRATEETR
jgi:hypothetical protein